jgi:DNA-binding winged helix-turn-helix (wHTH) protein
LARRRKDNLRRKTFDMLLYLVDHAGQLVTKAALLDAIWSEVTVSDSLPAICVAELRKGAGRRAEDPHGSSRPCMAAATSSSRR